MSNALIVEPTNNFVDVDGYPGYQINTNGVVISCKRNKFYKVKKQTKTKDGYMSICLNKDGKSKMFLVHRIVAKTFLLEIPGLQVNHKDGNKENNSVGNLEWVSHRENILHSYRVLGNKSPYKGKFGALHHASKKVDVDGNVFDCVREAAEYIGTNSFRLLSNIRKNRLLDGKIVSFANEEIK